MDLTQLRMFCSVAETGSLARAAEQLHRVPSNLTTRLRQLEIELGCDLFIREKQRIRLSAMGHNFLNYAQRILALSDEAMSITHAGEPAGGFALGSMESTAATRLPSLLAAYHQLYPQVSLSLNTATSGETIDGVREGKLAAALVDGPIDYDDINGCIAFRERLVIISPQGESPFDTPSGRSGHTVFAFRATCSYRTRLQSWIKHTGLAVGNIMEIQSYHAMVACVASGAGIAMVPRSVLDQLPGHERVQAHEIEDGFANTATWLIWRRDAFTPNVRALKELIIAQNGGVVPQLKHPIAGEEVEQPAV
ncbi:MAG: LysR substrate-binding domain-containing protein [Ewingella americana]|jgi:DNA-binding transcriptional LysR family regulator|uniref:putrescine utilization regulator PtrR n=1 Tax=Ewingella americana TaxID=41202 RepID=UPI00242D4E1F|nr:LysR family transcriptional regulator [Ewingella americana]MCI1677054.1 LysR substrate-binding domain-containing protein [Ewingella americana]MCI1853356.1 LysR substrate-binding domain-containing protein [Ewingella americana]MCI1860403.1 LysR substrate-binding domain-containing protein [Ewingella americana]MCI2141422.1 LysR substrate-binding domain-containing protein [Ewingella americana]MCI2162937.1 LysR substrate-binding domain-containing protein [Ewingella americana]